jgi:NNP family nitrate/nitrite transporter-like MFS transporter
MTFVVWLGLGPMMPFIKEALGLTNQQAQVLLILNVAMTIPSRIVVGMLVDKFGPRIMYSSILILGGLISIAFSWADSYEQLAILRFLSGFIGAGFVVGIRMIGEWFPAKQTGITQGIYGGWGNFGSAGAAMVLPFIAVNLVAMMAGVMRLLQRVLRRLLMVRFTTLLLATRRKAQPILSRKNQVRWRFPAALI